MFVIINNNFKLISKLKSSNSSLRKAEFRTNRFANMSEEDKKVILDHPFIRGIFTEAANKRRNKLFIENLGKRVGELINS